MPSPAPDLLVRHYRQLRESQGTVLLGPSAYADEAPGVEPSWYVDDCPLDPRAAVAAIAKRHGFRNSAGALRALRKVRRELEEDGLSDADALSDLPDVPVA